MKPTLHPSPWAAPDAAATGSDTRHARLLAWVGGITELCTPSAVHWCDGSDNEYARLCAEMVASGTLAPVAARPGSYICRTHASDTARVEDRTFVCTSSRDAAGPTNRWADPAEMKETLRRRFAGAMAGRTLYVVPFCMGPLGSPLSRIGVEITDSPYVVASMRIMARMGAAVLDQLGSDGGFIPCVHSVGRPLARDEPDVPWPCATDADGKLIVHFPEDPSIWSIGSGYGGNALLGKKCLALRIASYLARQEGWMAEHMLIAAVTPPPHDGRPGATRYIAAAFPSGCGKTNLAMLRPTLPGWTVRCVGDDIAWLHVGADGLLRAINPESGLFGVAPGTSERSNPHAMAAVARDTIFTNVATTPDGDVWWEGMTPEPPAGLVDWRGEPWMPGGGPAAHANARFTAPLRNCPIFEASVDTCPEGVPISAIVFGGRRPTTVPLVVEALSWEHGVFLGATASSESTPASDAAVGVLRRDPFAMLPFCGYHIGDYMAHWLAMGRRLGARAPRIFFVNWFRRDETRALLWPGYGDNIRVVKWMCGRLEGTAQAVTTPIGLLPDAGGIDRHGLDVGDREMAGLLAVDAQAWRLEADGIEAQFAQLGRVPSALLQQLGDLRDRLSGNGLPV